MVGDGGQRNMCLQMELNYFVKAYDRSHFTVMCHLSKRLTKLIKVLQHVT